VENPTSQRMAPVIIRKYPDETAFAADATKLAALGYRVAAQTWATGGLSGAGRVWFGIAALFAVLGFVAPPFWIVAILLLLLATTGRRKALTVTYQH
jgi:hypothetical protein